MKNYLLVALAFSCAYSTAADPNRLPHTMLEAEVPPYMNIKYFKTYDDAVSDANPLYIAIPITKSTYLGDIQDALRHRLGQGSLMMDGQPMHERQLKFFTIGQFFEPRKRMAQMTFADTEAQFSFWPAPKTIR